MSMTPYELADALYSAGYDDRKLERDYDPRGCTQWQAVVDAIPSPDNALPTEMGEILRKASNNPGRTANDIDLLTHAASECDRFYGGMMNWKANAQAKDRTIIELREELAQLRADVQEWACDACNTVYPGPPENSPVALFCPKCKGTTAPRATIERMRLEAKLEAITKPLDTGSDE